MKASAAGDHMDNILAKLKMETEKCWRKSQAKGKMPKNMWANQAQNSSSWIISFKIITIASSTEFVI